MKISLHDELHGNSSTNDRVISLAAEISGFTKAQCRTLMNLNRKEVVLERTQTRFLQKTSWFLLENRVKNLEGKVGKDEFDKYERNLYRYAMNANSQALRELQASELAWAESGILSSTYVMQVTEWSLQELLKFISTGEIDFGSFPEFEG